MESVRRMRREKGLSQRELADLAGVGQDSISGIETGKHEPHPRTLRKLAEALDVEVVDFFREPTLAGKPDGRTGREFADAYQKRLGETLADFYLAFASEKDSHGVNEAFDAVVGVMAEMEAEWDRRLTRRDGG